MSFIRLPTVIGLRMPLSLVLTTGMIATLATPLHATSSVQHAESRILRASDAQAGDMFGESLAISGDTIVVGAGEEDGGPGNPLPRSGTAYIFSRNQGGSETWVQVAVLRASDAQAEDFFGMNVAISGDTVVVGASGEDGGEGDPQPFSGAVYVFNRNQGGIDAWGQVAILRASDARPESWFGGEVAISGDTIVVGAPFDDGSTGSQSSNLGAAYIFDRNQGGTENWGEVAILHASDAQIGDFFGLAVAISGDTAVIGAELEDGGPGDPIPLSGAVYVFNRNLGGTDAWGEATILRASDAQFADFFGQAVDISGDTILVGVPEEDGGPGDPSYESGAVYVFNRAQGVVDTWTQAAVLHASDAQEVDYFGLAVAINADTVVIGAFLEDGGPGDPIEDSGAAYIFRRNQSGDNAWEQRSILRASDAQAGDYFGYRVDSSGDISVVGAIYEDGGAEDPLTDAGAAYLYNLSTQPLYLPLIFKHP